MLATTPPKNIIKKRKKHSLLALFEGVSCLLCQICQSTIWQCYFAHYLFGSVWKKDTPRRICIIIFPTKTGDLLQFWCTKPQKNELLASWVRLEQWNSHVSWHQCHPGHPQKSFDGFRVVSTNVDAKQKFQKEIPCLWCFSQWIGLRENLQETIDFPIKYGAFL